MQNIIDLLICKIGIFFVVLVPRLVSNDVLFLCFTAKTLYDQAQTLLKSNTDQGILK